MPDNRLVIASPGDDIGLSYNERITLGVRFQTEFGDALGDETVEFALVATGPGENTAGSVLSATSATTNAQGLAEVDLVAGAANVSFRVSADARDAPTRYFYIEISDGGFARVSITPEHAGWRALESFSRVEVRLYPSEALTCLEVDIDALPTAVSPPRSLDGFGGSVEYQSVAAGHAQTVVAWAEAAGNFVPVSAGCVDLGALPPSPVSLGMVIDDRPLVANASPIVTGLDLAPVVQELEAAGATHAWDVLGCVAGPGQLALDCALDSSASDGELDCVVAGTGPIVDAVAPRRGTLDANGCRSSMDANGMPSLDALATDAIALGASFPVDEELALVLQTRAEITSGWVLHSLLATLSGDALEHQLVTLEASTGVGDFALELGATSRPVLLAKPVTTTWQGQEPSLAAHGFTLRGGRFAALAFADLGLAEVGLESQENTLGRALLDSLEHGGDTGCQALSRLVCTDVGQTTSCLASACEQGVLALDTLLTDWWRGLDATGLDFHVAGRMRAVDTDGDRVIESVTAAPGAATPWAATLSLSDGRVIPVPTALE